MEVVDGDGVFVGRPYLTIVTDVATRAILGYCLTLEKAVGPVCRALSSQAICPTETWLATRNLSHALLVL